jgi:hypothetical protein
MTDCMIEDNFNTLTGHMIEGSFSKITSSMMDSKINKIPGRMTDGSIPLGFRNLNKYLITVLTLSSSEYA